MGKPSTGFSIPVNIIRTVAIVAVILLHATADLTVPQMNQFEIIRWSTNDVYQSIGRVGVPLFVMLSGALLLQPGKNDTLASFFKKRLARIGPPWIFWGAVYFAWDFLVKHRPLTPNFVVRGILTGPYYQFWYLYMLLGLYLLTPILRIILSKVSRFAIELFLVFWFIVAAVLPFVGALTTYGLFGKALSTGWVPYLVGYLTLVFDFLGYFILGALLVNVRIRRSLFAILLAVGVALTAISIYIIQSQIGGNRAVFAFTVYFGAPTILTAVVLFLLLNTIRVPAQSAGTSKGGRLLCVISQNTLALFLFHVIVLESLQRGYFGFAINGNTINTIVGVPLITVITLFVSLGIILLLKRIPYLRRL